MINKKLLENKPTHDELNQLVLFKNRVNKLAQNSLFIDGFKPIADLYIDNGIPRFDYQLPSEEAFESLLMRFRHFWLEKELCSFNRIRNIVHRYMPHQRELTDALKISWNQGMFHSVSILNDGVQLTSKDIVDIWLNSEFFHSQAIEKTKLDVLVMKIESNNSPELVRFFLVVSIFEFCKAIFQLNELVKKLS